jgi:NAD(P)-dependent dehydrogenase (short-subunit alcohol dehydrogenase family)
MTAKGTVLITGGSRGIGAATVRLAAKRGYAVCFSYRSNTGAAEQLVQEVEAAGGRALAVQSDVGNGDAIKQLFDRCDRQFGPISALVNNAGITGGILRLDAVEPETVRRVLEVNVLGTILCCQEAVRRMSTAYGVTGGAIVNISSGVTRSGGASEYIWYGATKGAVDTFTIGLAREVGPEGIRVNAISPGLTQTDIHVEGSDAARVDRLAPQIPLGRAATPEEIAEPIMWLLSDEARYIAGEILLVSGGR